jgi:hypothetical protein
MIEETVKQTRCTTCDADHEYRGAKVPAPRRRKPGTPEGVLVARPRRVATPAEPEPEPELEPIDEPIDAPEPEKPAPLELAASAPEPVNGDLPTDTPAEHGETDEWPVHRPLIRATLPRPEGQVPERKAPDFTFRPAGGRFDSHRNGQRKSGHRPTRHASGQPSGQGRFGGPRAGQGSRHGAGPGQGSGQRHGNKQGPGGGGRPGQNRGTRQGGGGRKRGR